MALQNTFTALERPESISSSRNISSEALDCCRPNNHSRGSPQLLFDAGNLHLASVSHIRGSWRDRLRTAERKYSFDLVAAIQKYSFNLWLANSKLGQSPSSSSLVTMRACAI